MVPRVLEWTGLHLHRVTDLTQGVFCDALAMICVYSYIHYDFFLIGDLHLWSEYGRLELVMGL